MRAEPICRAVGMPNCVEAEVENKKPDAYAKEYRQNFESGNGKCRETIGY